MNIIPKELVFTIGEYKKTVEHIDGVFTIKDTMKKELKEDKISVTLLGQVIDTIEKDIMIKKGDVLHFEYHLNAELLR